MLDNRELDPLDVEEEVVRRTARDAVPRGVEIQDNVMNSLVGIARQMMVRHAENWPRMGNLREGDVGVEEWAAGVERDGQASYI